jgi:GNAT superfamily N-acetyltransferase
MITREANIGDWDKLNHFFLRIYRKNHPLLKKEFWDWQYGDSRFGRSFICLNEQNEIVGHVGANFGGGLAWIINVYLDEECRGKGILSKLYSLARNYYPLAATAANEAGLGLYQNMRWYRYHDLVRFVKINPSLSSICHNSVCRQIKVEIDDLLFSDSHYFKQPGIKGIKFNCGSTAISQTEVGGLRIVDLENLKNIEDRAWDLGYLWLDYITSWNDLKTRELKNNSWVEDFKSVVPWRLNPIEEGYFCDITFLSEKCLDNELIVHRSYSDHGRIGSL